MSLTPQAAFVRGSDYHHAIAWYWACRMLSAPDRIASVSVEDSSGGAFDDIVVRGYGGHHIFIQAKSSNFGDVIVGDEFLLQKGAGGSSPLMRFFESFKRLREIEPGETFALELWTNRGFDHDHPLLGKLLDLKHDRINVEKLSDAGPSTSIGKKRTNWADHLEISADELAAFLGVVRWKRAGSEFDLREDAKPLMELAGLRADDNAVTAGIAIVRSWVSDGAGAQSAADVGRSAQSAGLVPEFTEVVDPNLIDNQTSRLPPRCAFRIQDLRVIDPEAAGKLTALLVRDSSRTPGVLAGLIDSPPDWLKLSQVLAIEALAEFALAHQIPGGEELLARAIQSESTRADLHRFRMASAARDRNDDARAREIVEQLPADHPIRLAIESQLAGDSDGVISALEGEEPLVGPDADSPIFLATIAEAHYDSGRLETSVSVLRETVERFPDRPGTRCVLAMLEIELAQSQSAAGVSRHDLLDTASSRGLAARDYYRMWHGPSEVGTDIAARALLLLDDPAAALKVATASPSGDATVREASTPAIAKLAAYAHLALGRIDELDEIDPELIGGFDGAFLRAMQSHAYGDPSARELIEQSLAAAKTDSDRLMALHALANCGVVDEHAMNEVKSARQSDITFLKAVAAFHRHEDQIVESLLGPYRLRTVAHAELLARAQFRSGDVPTALETLTGAVRLSRSGSPYAVAVELLMGEGDLEEAEQFAQSAVSGSLSRQAELRMRLALIEIANRRTDWPKLEGYAKAAIDKFPDADIAHWMMVLALVNQFRLAEARRYATEHQLDPKDEDSARLAIRVFSQSQDLEADPRRLLEIAGRFADSAIVAGEALGEILRADAPSLGDSDRSKLAEMLQKYFVAFPDSVTLRSFNVDGPEAALEVMGEIGGPLPVEAVQIANRVKFGELPYGLLRTIRALPYAELLLAVAAGHFTAIPTDPRLREAERLAVRAALGKPVAIDASAAAFMVLAGINPDELIEPFKRVVIADELIADARAAVLSASASVAGYAVTDPVSGTPVVVEVDEQREALRARANALLVAMLDWYSVPSGHLSARWAEHADRLRPWDASVRVAIDKGIPLWCDDLALRKWANSEGIKTFGTYAVYEALSEAGCDLCQLTDQFKLGLLRAGIVDVPLTWQEIDGFVKPGEALDVGVLRVLERPSSWESPETMLRWCWDRIRDYSSGPEPRRAWSVLHSAICGAGALPDPSVGRRLMVGLLTYAISCSPDPEKVKELVLVSEYAFKIAIPSQPFNLLAETASALFRAAESAIGADQAAQHVVNLFSKCSEAQRREILTEIFG
ncbi:MAG: hypothetical protein F4Z80_00100 [Chloroflexi bacterium]|nr:hypothetical protein [Chloroflexota bacterium]MYC48666.1 hypothetical protein [Chloroflexota bacterium]